MNGYQNLGCRCRPCRDAHAAWTRDGGRCGACSRYLDRNGIDRPARLWRPGEADAADDGHLEDTQTEVAA